MNLTEGETVFREKVREARSMKFNACPKKRYTILKGE